MPCSRAKSSPRSRSSSARPRTSKNSSAIKKPSRPGLRPRPPGLLPARDLTEHLQDRFYTMRGSRYVIPIKSEARPRFQGIVHDSSASGATLYLEPARSEEHTSELQ